MRNTLFSIIVVLLAACAPQPDPLYESYRLGDGSYVHLPSERHMQQLRGMCVDHAAAGWCSEMVGLIYTQTGIIFYEMAAHVELATLDPPKAAAVKRLIVGDVKLLGLMLKEFREVFSPDRRYPAPLRRSRSIFCKLTGLIKRIQFYQEFCALRATKEVAMHVKEVSASSPLCEVAGYENILRLLMRYFHPDEHVSLTQIDQESGGGFIVAAGGTHDIGGMALNISLQSWSVRLGLMNNKNVLIFRVSRALPEESDNTCPSCGQETQLRTHAFRIDRDTLLICDHCYLTVYAPE